MKISVFGSERNSMVQVTLLITCIFCKFSHSNFRKFRFLYDGFAYFKQMHLKKLDTAIFLACTFWKVTCKCISDKKYKINIVLADKSKILHTSYFRKKKWFVLLRNNIIHLVSQIHFVHVCIWKFYRIHIHNLRDQMILSQRFFILNDCKNYVLFLKIPV